MSRRFGQPSEPLWPQTPLLPTTENSSGSPDTYDRRSLLNWLKTLNEASRPYLSSGQLQGVRDYVLERSTHLVGRPIHEAFGAELQQLVAATLFAAKHPDDRRRQECEMATSTLGQFLVQLNGFIAHRNEQKIAEWLPLEPPFNASYQNMIQELQQHYPRGSEDALDGYCTQRLGKAVEGDDMSPWTPFIKFMVQYLSYLRDVSADVSRYLETYQLLSELQQRANSALGHSTLGHLILPVVVANAKLVCRLAIGLDRQPELVAQIRSAARAGGGGGGEEDGARETLPEKAANILRQAFVTCLNDRVSGLSPEGRPEGKKRGIYIIANLCLKILFQCRKTRNATQIFENIYNLSPPLSAYPKRERVTYLYYLGRYLFQNSHFHRAQLVLQYAYDEAPARPECARQRRHLLVYLLAANLTLGRFPSPAIFERPEAAGLQERFLPLCYAIRTGDLAAFHRHLSYKGEHAEWFLHFRMLLQLRNRCEVLVWRALVRLTWKLSGTRPAEGTKNAPTLGLPELATAFHWSETHLNPSPYHPDNAYTDPDFAGISYGYEPQPYDNLAIESKLASLIDQGLLTGYLAHKQAKLCITGLSSKSKDDATILATGFPVPWAVFRAKVEREEKENGRAGGEVPGWKQRGGPAGGALARGGVVNLSGARAVGVGG